jgi:hypothetical protein
MFQMRAMDPIPKTRGGIGMISGEYKLLREEGRGEVMRRVRKRSAPSFKGCQ